MSQFAIAHTPDAATDDRIDPQIHSFLAELNKDSPAETGMIGNIRAKSGAPDQIARSRGCPIHAGAPYLTQLHRVRYGFEGSLLKTVEVPSG